ncbi:phosphatidylinositol 3 [Ophiocordyceps sinensis CO18]|uniref:Serine/threonine-protein kinase MEC1 n=1 Tax=Ophiocordyceps sinensis (strain Co18 / CGMCC 3.14243) TaxID=911162 RepID=T5ACZ0_OPHSC|nr:phosphatidylinositol 3 [Ophiocordyceps sinensis CO18]
MVESLRGKAAATLGVAGMADGSADGVPPSTLAAQLVENISASTKSSRSDESSELKRLFAVIQRVKDSPGVLKSHGERVEHNHMLIYVYCRVALEGIKLDDPFLDRSHVHSELLKAVTFLRFSIKETPIVLASVDHGQDFLHRGKGPLWAWLLPHLLRILGHDMCTGLEGPIEGLLQYIMMMVYRTSGLWWLRASLSLYLRACLTGLLDHLQDPSLMVSNGKTAVCLHLPPIFALDQILGDTRQQNPQRSVYAVGSASQAIRQALSLARVLAYPLVSQDTWFSCTSSLSQNGPLLMDSWLDLRHLQKRWDASAKSSPVALMEMALNVAKCSAVNTDLPPSLKSKANALLVLLCSEMISCPGVLVEPDPTGEQSRVTFCKALLAISDASLQSYAIGRLASSKLVQELALLSTQYPPIGEDTDVWRCMRLLRQVIYVPAGGTPDESTHPSKFQHQDIRQCVEGLRLARGQPAHAATSTKRRKISGGEDNALHLLTQAIYESLQTGPSGDEDVVVFEQLFLSGFEKSSEENQCLSIELLSRICCVADGRVSPPDSTAPIVEARCAICDGVDGMNGPVSSHVSKSEARLVFSKLVNLPKFLESRRPRVAAMMALRRLVHHCEDRDFLDLDRAGPADVAVLTPGRWCLQSLINSSVRELRVAAGRTLATFMPQRPIRALDQDLLYRNRKYSITVLKETSENDQPHLVETRILAWGQLGRVVTEDELNLILIKLLEYLGSNNSIVSAFAFNELLNLAESRSRSPRRLFEPFWKNLAYMVTKEMVHRPQRSRAIAELLQISVNELLLLIQSHALPWLVLENRQDVIQKIAEARREMEPWHALTDGPNLATILALLLVQDADNMANFTKSRLDAVSPHFHRLTLLDLFQSEPVLTALELLRAATVADAVRQQVIHKALHLMATTLLSANKDAKPKKSNVIGHFLQSHVLGLMARLTDVINDSVSIHPPILEQRSCIRTLEEMIKYSKSYARIARPQISACLLSAMSQDALREASFSCWVAMLTNLEEEDVEALIEATFFIINRYWTAFNASTTRAAQEMLNLLLDKHEAIVTAYISKLPSLSHIVGLADVESRLSAMRPVLATDEALHVFAERIAHDNSGVVHQALTELAPYLRDNQSALYTSAVSQRPDSAITYILRALLDSACKYNGVQLDIARLCVECIGLIGCLDSNRIETVREQRSIVVLSNFEGVGETTNFGLFLLQEVLVPSFLSANDTKLQGFLSFAIQEILVRCDIRAACAMQNTGMVGGNDIYRKWIALPETVREVVTPFLTSRYVVAPMAPVTVEYPVFHPGKPYVNWLRPFVVDLLQHGQNEQAETIFEPLTRVIRVKDLSTAEFLLPYLVLHVLLGPRSTRLERDQVVGELMGVLSHRAAASASYVEKEEMKKYCHAVFRVLDYAMRWIQAKRSAGRLTPAEKGSVSRIQKILDDIPAELISQRAVDCNEYARALFHLEQHAQKLEQDKKEPGDRTRLLEQLQDIYANIDEPDGLDGISAHMHALDINQQILSHKKAGRWTAAQTWYEIQLAEKPDNADVHFELLHCLKQAGQYDALLNHVQGIRTEISTDSKMMPFAVEAAWVTGRWESLAKFTSRFHGDVVQDFNISVAALFDSLYNKCRPDSFSSTVRSIREKIASEMTSTATSSLQAAHDLLLKCHVLTDLEIIVGFKAGGEEERRRTMALLSGRFEVIGAYYHDKQYLLGIRRAAMELTRPSFADTDISSLWLASARLARKTDSLHQSFNAVLHASRLGDDAATIENAKLLWRDNHHRKAIQMLQGAIEGNKFMTQTESSVSTDATKLSAQQKLVVARAQLLLAKWLDAAGQSHAGALREKYQQPPKTYPTWEKGHYYLGRHYKKILESEQPLKADDQSDNYVTGEIARLVIENYVDKPPEGKVSLSRELHRRRVDQLNLLHAFLDKYIHRLPAYIFYTALPQIVAPHPNCNVFDRLTHIIVKVVEAHPRQALWSLIGIMTSRQMSERKARGTQILQALRNVSRKVDGTAYDLKQLLRVGEKLAEQLLLACHNGDFTGNKAVHASLSRDLRFQHKCTPCPLAVPVESSLMATLPAVSEHVKKHKAFSRDVVTIDCFLDDVLVLSSLAKPRRLTARGSDGKSYMLLIKPKDDLRTDQRLMEFNGIINRSLKRDAESSRRQLYIRTYAVIPLNEECGIIEWVPGIRTMRDILLNLYASRKVQPDYPALKSLMEEASTSESKLRLFTEDVLGRFPPVLPLWFIQQFPSPSSWLSARLRYTRSCAVMSMVGTMLGLGDRHGENVNLEEGNGGVFHVDFNCLFDKGLTFLKPERVPFRLTHNMVAAMGIYGYEGPFRKSSELTLSILRQQEETLMTILEAFIYDPTLDLQKEKRSSKRADSGVKLQPQSVVDSIKRKVKGLLPNESIPLSVEGQVEELIKQAVDARNLTAMYIGWCPFL